MSEMIKAVGFCLCNSMLQNKGRRSCSLGSNAYSTFHSTSDLCVLCSMTTFFFVFKTFSIFTYVYSVDVNKLI